MAVALSLGFAQAASAADMPVKAAPMAPAPVVYNWTGCYVGAEGGYIWGRQNVNDAGSGAAVTTIDPKGGIIGGTLGCNWQTGTWVFGVEDDLSWAGLSGSVSDQPPYNTVYSHGVKNTWLDTLRARAGIAMDRWFFYMTGGAAFTNVQDYANNGAGLIVSNTTTKVGWTVGGGFEVKLPDPRWSVKAEYLYIDLGSQTDNFALLPGSFINVTTHLKENIARVGINYKLN